MTMLNEYRVTGMSCGHCETSVRDEVSKLDGVEQVDVSAATGRLLITSALPLSDSAVIAAVDEAGYEAARI
ncbi:heavy-metal-associated domain-containing protein [Microbacterium sp. cf046]|uniref:heavy-metal-associated domain-containing protein n=1 Tax=Microbacterium sp. cf046 TaxID=1761803 RepID=UPI000B863C52|nr:heavy metal-associated domain-containing protein [Microbacterium sp. cf046]